MIRPVMFSLLFVAATPAYADDNAVEKYKNYLPDDILKLSADERLSVPFIYIDVANIAKGTAGDLINKANLNTLMYNGIYDYDSAKKAFQADLGEEPTGDLTVWQIYTLGYRSSRANLTYVSFFALDYGGVINNDWASVKGTVQIIDERIAYPINHVSITCDRARSTCIYLQVALILPDEKSWTQSYNVVQVANETYKITRWEADQIDAVPNEKAACRTNQLSLNFTTNEFYEIARNNTAGDCETAVGIVQRLEKPRVSQIVDGSKIMEAEFKRLSDEAYGFLSSAFRKQIDALKTK